MNPKLTFSGFFRATVLNGRLKCFGYVNYGPIFTTILSILKQTAKLNLSIPLEKPEIQSNFKISKVSFITKRKSLPGVMWSSTKCSFSSPWAHARILSVFSPIFKKLFRRLGMKLLEVLWYLINMKILTNATRTVFEEMIWACRKHLLGENTKRCPFLRSIS